MKKIIVIVGATASHKSSLALKLAKVFDAEIISADSFQVYKELNIGINKPSNDELNSIKHYFVNYISIYDSFDIKIFQDACLPIIDNILSRNKNVIICGGSNQYVDAVIKGYKLDKANSRESINYFENWEYEDIYKFVLDNDPTEALKINFNNKKRIIRAAQIIKETNKPKSSQDCQKHNYIFDCFIIQTVMDRELLYARINDRVDQMYNNGWFNEVLNLYKNDNNIHSLMSFNAIGYRQILNSIINNNEVNLDEIKLLTRRYAKKQMTWCNNQYKEIYKFDYNNDDFEKLVSLIKDFIK